jgi:hypothetical protein
MKTPPLEIENIMLRSMCKAAAREIELHWDAHCDEEGYGPINLLSRLNGDFRPDLYPCGVTEDEQTKVLEWLKNG